MWVALHALEERIAAKDRLLERTESSGMALTGARLRDDLGEMSRSAATLRQFLEQHSGRTRVSGDLPGAREVAG